MSAAGSEETTITSSPIVLTMRASSGSVLMTVSTKRSTALTASSSQLLGELGVAGEVDEGDRHPQLPEVERVAPRSVSMCPMTSCSMKCCRKRWWTWFMIGEPAAGGPG